MTTGRGPSSLRAPLPPAGPAVPPPPAPPRRRPRSSVLRHRRHRRRHHCRRRTGAPLRRRGLAGRPAGQAPHGRDDGHGAGRPGLPHPLSPYTNDLDTEGVVYTKWWQYREEGTYPGSVPVADAGSAKTRVTVPADAQPGQTLSFIFQATDDGPLPLTRYARIILTVG
ncbi:hypothetical protein GCM10009740_01660 [Terrabacter terrae]|uniref:Cellulose-binding Sde182 C-terminal domain-containing protein n=1 Tax=Terrabacter terrae TaxID=318434 RepID=A0ABP5F9G4_9MICO